MKFLSFIFLLLFALSCHPTIRKIQPSDLYGDWLAITTNKPSPNIVHSGIIPPGCRFFADSVEMFSGFPSKRPDIICDYFGSFKLDNDTIKIFNACSNFSSKWTILQYRNDTMFLQTDNHFFGLKRLNPQIDSSFKFDEIAFSASGCFSKCPILDIIINPNGNTIFHGGDFVDKIGFYTGKMPVEHYAFLQKEILKASPSKLDTTSYGKVGDGESLSITFLLNKKIIKTITDHGYNAPPYLVWAFIDVKDAYKKAILHPISENILTEYNHLNAFVLLSKKQILRLSMSESFYLWNEIRNGAETNTTFTPTFSLGYPGINTDGRYYEVYFKNKKIIIDIGYNFLERNNLIDRLQK